MTQKHYERLEATIDRSLSIESYQEGLKLECEYLYHTFTLDRESLSSDWYMHVTDDEADSFNVVCDGYISGSEDLSAAGAFEQACKGAMIDVPEIESINRQLIDFATQAK